MHVVLCTKVQKGVSEAHYNVVIYFAAARHAEVVTADAGGYLCE